MCGDARSMLRLGKTSSPAERLATLNCGRQMWIGLTTIVSSAVLFIQALTEAKLRLSQVARETFESGWLRVACRGVPLLHNPARMQQDFSFDPSQPKPQPIAPAVGRTDPRGDPPLASQAGAPSSDGKPSTLRDSTHGSPTAQACAGFICVSKLQNSRRYLVAA